MAIAWVSMVLALSFGLQAADPPPPDVAYDEFMKLSVEVRQERFGRLTPENRSQLKRAHAEAWLQQHRQSLSQQQQALVREAIAFLSPELYRDTRPSRALVERDDQLRQRLECAFTREQLTAAFTFLGPPPPPSLPERVDRWLSWFSGCVLK